MERDNEYMVDIPMCTYNHERYLAEAIDSVLMQKCDFKFRLFVGEDCSTDNTREILKSYVEKYPNIIFPIYHSSNLGANQNTKVLFNMCTSKYIALLDGDDYWTDEYKLQKQVDILENHPECVACHHWQKIAVKNESGNFIEKKAHKEIYGYFPQQISGLRDIFAFRLRPATRTLLFRNIFDKATFPKWFYEVKFGDLSLCFILGGKGNFYFLDEPMAVYRIIEGGQSSVFKNSDGYIEGNKEWIKILSHALNYYSHQFTKEALEGMYLLLSRIRNHTGNSMIQRIKLMWFVLTKINDGNEIKIKLIYSLLKNRVYTNPVRYLTNY